MSKFQSLFLHLVIIHLCHGSEKVSHRRSRQTLEDDPAENKIAGTWGPWGPWSSCSQTCALGVIERSRTCLSPYQQVPWAPRSEQNPHNIQPHPEPPFRDERGSIYSMGQARPSYPLHVAREVAAPFVEPYVPRNPSHSRYNQFNRNAREETFAGGSQPSYTRRDQPPYHRSTSNRGRTAPQPPETLWQPSPLDVPHRQDALRAPETISIHRKPHQDVPFNRKNNSRVDDPSQPWPFFPDSIPLLKPDSWEETNPGREMPPLSPTKETRFSRRPRVRNVIKPGRYGYGKVPFALPLHTEKDEAQRFRRHHKLMTLSTTASPRRERKKGLAATQKPIDSMAEHGTETPGQSIDFFDTSLKKIKSSSKKPKRSSETDQPSWPEKLELEGDSREHSSLGGEADSFLVVGRQSFNHQLQDSFWDTETGREEDDILHATENRNSGTLHGSKTRTLGIREKLEQKISSTEPPPLTGTSKPMQSKVVGQSVDIVARKLASGYQVFSGKKSSDEPVVNPYRQSRIPVDYSDGSNHERVEHELHSQKSDPSHRPRSRSQRQSPYRHGTDGSRAYQSIFRDQPSRPLQGDTWASLGRNPSLTFERAQDPRQSHHQNSEVPLSLYNPGTEEFHCAGPKKQYKSCTQEPCPAGQPDARTLQCSTFNNQEFMGRLYQWEAFTEVSGNQRCALNCRPIGYRFYVRHTEKVQDGTPCEAGSLDVCVDGQCLSPGCDGILGSNSTLDTCGVCGGDGSTCKFITGTFKDTNIPIGYHKILEIPKGATQISVRELTWSPNYLGCIQLLQNYNSQHARTANGCPGMLGVVVQQQLEDPFWETLVYVEDRSFFRVLYSTQCPKKVTWSRPHLVSKGAANPGTALRNRSGKSIINGNWAVDPPGKYEAGSTVFTYIQPGRDEQEGESFTAPGPTSEALDVYMIFQQDNPGISFQYFISSPPSSDNPSHVSNVQQQEYGSLRSMPSSDSLPQTNLRNPPVEERSRVSPPQARPPPPPPRPAGTLQRNIRIPPLSAPPVHYWPEQPQFFWRRVGNTPCSVTCGKGFWYPIYQCVSRSSLDEVNEEECDSSTKPFPQEEACNTQPCPAFWDVGNWSVCSRTCGSGIQHRQVLCRQMYANRTTMVHPQRCSNLVKPNVTQTCQLRICSQWEIQSNWTTCSVMCGLGQRTRNVRCVSNQGDVVGEGECSNRLRPRTKEVCDMGPCVRSWFHNEWSSTCSSECGPGIQRRSVFCLSSSPLDESQEGCPGNKPSDMRVCNSGPCERTIKWYTGPWSQCSADCDEGSQRRDVICISKMGSDFNVTDASECAHLEKPPSLQSCNAGPCGSRWFTTPWSTCSQSCEGGVQLREVRCLAADKTYSQQCDLDSKPDEKKACNPQPCSSVLDDNCRDRYHNCAVVVQARLCVYSYYKQACCSSCAHSLQRRTSESR